MGLDAKATRRWLGALALVTAMAMLVAEETLLKGRLSLLASLLFWLACLALTATAMAAALLDLRALRRQSREKQRNLLQETLKDIQLDAKSRTRRRSP